MNRITLVDYIGYCDSKGEVTGHTAKTLKETKEMLSDSYDVSMVVTPPYAQFFDDSCIASVLPYESSPQRQSSKFKKIGLYIKKIRAVRNIVNNESTVWFVNTDFWLYVGLLFSKKKKRQKIFATNYLDFYSKKNLKNFIYNCAVKKINCVFHTNVELKRDKHQYVPDYWFDKRKYDKYFVKDFVIQAGYPLDMRYAGPREALLHATFRQNYGINRQIVGRDHAGVGDFYGMFEAQEIFDKIPQPAEEGKRLLCQPLKIDWTFYCHKCDGMASMRTCPHSKEDRVILSGTKLRKFLSEGKEVPDHFGRPEVLAILKDYYAHLQNKVEIKMQRAASGSTM